MEKTQIVLQEGTHLRGAVTHGRKRVSDHGHGSKLFPEGQSRAHALHFQIGIRHHSSVTLFKSAHLDVSRCFSSLLNRYRVQDIILNFRYLDQQDTGKYERHDSFFNSFMETLKQGNLSVIGAFIFAVSAYFMLLASIKGN
jgi:hypothetical protein